MTARQFREDITDFADLSDFLDDENDEYLSDADIRYYDDLDSVIDEDVDNFVRYDYDGWYELYSYLGDVGRMDHGEGWYHRNGSFDYDFLTQTDFEDIKAEIYERYANNGWFEEDDEDEYEEEEEPVDPEDLIPLEEEDVSFDELFASGVEAVLKAQEERIENQKKKEAEETAKLEHMLFSAAFA